jgi:phage terminase small subunit
MKLTPKQQAFCEHYIASLNATDAARQAGYKKPNQQGPANLVKLGIKKYIDERLAELASARLAAADEVLEHLTAVMRGEVKETLVGFYEGGACSTTKPVSERDRLKAAELLGKRYGLFTERMEVNGKLDTSNLLDDILKQMGG